MSKSCNTCTHWDEYSSDVALNFGGNVRVCLKAADGDDMIVVNAMMERADAELLTNSTFACSNWERISQ